MKKVLVLITALLFNAFVGVLFASVTGFDAIVTTSATLGVGLLAKPVAGVLPFAVNITTGYAGEVLEKLLVRATTTNELVEGGHIHIQPNVKDKFSIPRLKTGKVLQKRKEMPTQADSKGNFAIDEKVLEPQDVMAFTTFNPRAFEHIWRPFQPKGNLVFRELDPEVQNQLLSELAKTVSFELGNEFINGIKGTAEGQYFDGVLTRIKNDTDTLKVLNPEALTEANIISKLKAVVQMIPKPLKGQLMKKNVKLFMSVEDAELYDYVLTDKPQKGADYTGMNPERFKGYKIVPLADWPKDTIVAAYATSGTDSNFWGAVDYVNDADVVQIDKLTNSGELYFFKMLMKIDTNTVFGEDIVLYGV